jgi:tRNA A-37 threonylcarbamoyl transferase component Bud32
MSNSHKQDDGILTGGWGQDNPPEKIGNTVHREMGKNSDYVHQVLAFLKKQGYTFAPDYIGTDERGREIIEFIDGYTPHGQEVPKATWSLETMTEIFQQIRKLHDLTAGTELAQDKDCVCHGDPSYANTVYRDGKAVAFIDWDLAHPGNRVEDVAYAIMQYLSIGEYISPNGPEERAELARKLADAYGLTTAQRALVTDAMLAALHRTRQEQLALIAKGTAGGKKLAEADVPDILLKRYNWLSENKAVFKAVLT